MPPSWLQDCRQKAVLWEKVAATSASAGYGEDGQALVKDPVELDVRWEEDVRQAVDREGAPVAILATVVVDRFIPVGSVLALGTLSDWGFLGTADAIETGSLMEVVTYMEVPDTRGRYFYREVGLKHFRGTLPAIGE